MTMHSGEGATPAQSPFVLVPQYFGSTVFDRSTSKYMPFDHQATQLLIQLRTEPFDDIVAKVSDGESRRGLTRFFEDFYRLGFFSVGGRFVGAVLNAQPPEDHLLGPLAVHLEVVAACNLRCSHCFAGTLPRREEPLTLDDFGRLFGTLASMGSFRLGLTGGEPLLRRDIFDIIDLAVEHGLHPCLTTNGLLITEEVAHQFGKRDLVWLNVSLEGATAHTNDSVRGDGTFARVLANLSVLSRHSPFTLAFTIMRSNLDEIERCADLARRVGAETAVFRPLYPVGTALSNMHLMPSFAEYNEALNVLAGTARGTDIELRSLEPFGPHTRTQSQAVTHANHGCGAGNLVCSISISGDVNPCSFLGSAFVADNIRRRPFPDIWHDSQGFQEIRALPGPSGLHDPDGQVFSGGCRARALTFNGSINAPDPWMTEQAVTIAQRTSGSVRQSPCHHPSTILEVTRRE